MAIRNVRIGSLVDIHQYDDGDYDKSISVEDPISVSSAPVDNTDVLRLEDVFPNLTDAISTQAYFFSRIY